MRCYKCGSFLTDGDTCPQCGENVRIYKIKVNNCIIKIVNKII